MANISDYYTPQQIERARKLFFKNTFKNTFTLPADHKPGMRVPIGGSSCSTCVYLKPDRVSCGNDYFVQWNGSATIPAPVDRYCSDWYEPIPEALL